MGWGGLVGRGGRRGVEGRLRQCNDILGETCSRDLSTARPPRSGSCCTGLNAEPRWRCARSARQALEWAGQGPPPQRPSTPHTRWSQRVRGPTRPSGSLLHGLTCSDMPPTHVDQAVPTQALQPGQLHGGAEVSEHVQRSSEQVPGNLPYADSEEELAADQVLYGVENATQGQHDARQGHIEQEASHGDTRRSGRGGATEARGLPLGLHLLFNNSTL